MGGWVLVNVILGFSLLVTILSHPLTKRDDAMIIKKSKGQLSSPSDANSIKASDVNYQQYSVEPFSKEEAISIPYTDIISYNSYPNDISNGEPEIYSNIAHEFNSVESERGSYNDKELQNRELFLDTAGYKQYESQSSINMQGPKQVEVIDTNSYHKEVGPYDTDAYTKHHNKEEEEQAEVHYHQHKHLHKHQHKQEHMHKHKEEHKHEHAHQHHSDAHHEHKHNQEHKHNHHSEHKHKHHSMHQHKHKQEHKHDHYHGHKHEHKHKEEHKHEQQHKHKHEQRNEHKHKHWSDHKHDHHHGHKHWSDHIHEHKHQNQHNHKHGYKHDHKYYHYKSKW